MQYESELIQLFERLKKIEQRVTDLEEEQVMETKFFREMEDTPEPEPTTYLETDK